MVRVQGGLPCHSRCHTTAPASPSVPPPLPPASLRARLPRVEVGRRARASSMETPPLGLKAVALFSSALLLAAPGLAVLLPGTACFGGSALLGASGLAPWQQWGQCRCSQGGCWARQNPPARTAGPPRPPPPPASTHLASGALGGGRVGGAHIFLCEGGTGGWIECSAVPIVHAQRPRTAAAPCPPPGPRAAWGCGRSRRAALAALPPPAALLLTAGRPARPPPPLSRRPAAATRPPPPPCLPWAVEEAAPGQRRRQAPLGAGGKRGKRRPAAAALGGCRAGQRECRLALLTS